MSGDSYLTEDFLHAPDENADFCDSIIGDRCAVTFWTVDQRWYDVVVVPRTHLGPRVLADVAVDSAVSWLEENPGYFSTPTGPLWCARWWPAFTGYGTFAVERIRQELSAWRVVQVLFEHFEREAATHLLTSSILTGGPLGEQTSP